MAEASDRLLRSPGPVSHVAFAAAAETATTAPLRQEFICALDTLHRVEAWLRWRRGLDEALDQDLPRREGGGSRSLLLAWEASGQCELLANVRGALLVAGPDQPSYVAAQLWAYADGLTRRGFPALAADVCQTVMTFAQMPEADLLATEPMGHVSRAEARTETEFETLVERVEQLVDAGETAEAEVLVCAVLRQRAWRTLPELVERIRLAWARIGAAHNAFDAAIVRGWRVWTQSRDGKLRDRALLAVGEWCLDLGHYRDAREVFALVEESAVSTESRTRAWIALMGLAAIDGRELEFERHRRAVQGAPPVEQSTVALYHYEAGRGYRTLGKSTQARKEFERALDTALEASAHALSVLAEGALVDLAHHRVVGPRPPRVPTPAIACVFSAVRCARMARAIGNRATGSSARHEPPRRPVARDPLAVLSAYIRRALDPVADPAAPMVLRKATADLRAVLEDSPDGLRLWGAADGYGAALLVLERHDMAAAWYGGLVPLLRAAGALEASGWAAVAYAEALQSKGRSGDALAAYLHARAIAEIRDDRRLRIAAEHGEAILESAANRGLASATIERLVAQARGEAWPERVTALLLDRAALALDAAEHVPPDDRDGVLYEALAFTYQGLSHAQEGQSDRDVTHGLFLAASTCGALRFYDLAVMAAKAVVVRSPAGSMSRHRAACVLVEMANRQGDAVAFARWRAMLERASIPPALRVRVLTAIGEGCRLFGEESEGQLCLAGAAAFVGLGDMDGRDERRTTPVVALKRAPGRRTGTTDRLDDRVSAHRNGTRAHLIAQITNLLETVNGESATLLDAASGGIALLEVARQARDGRGEMCRQGYREVQRRLKVASLPNGVVGALTMLSEAVLSMVDDGAPLSMLRPSVLEYSDALLGAGLFLESDGWFAAMASLPREPDEEWLVGVSLVGRATTAQRLAKHDTAIGFASQALAVGERLHDDDLVLHARSIIAVVTGELAGKHEEALRLIEGVMADAERLGKRDRLVAAVATRANLLADLGRRTADSERRRALLTESVRSAYALLARWDRDGPTGRRDTLDVPGGRRPVVLINIGHALRWLGLYDAAEDAFHVAAAEAVRVDLWHAAMINLLELAVVRRDRVRFERFRRQLATEPLYALAAVAYLLYVGSGLCAFGEQDAGRAVLRAARALAVLYQSHGHLSRIDAVLSSVENRSAPVVADSGGSPADPAVEDVRRELGRMRKRVRSLVGAMDGGT